MPLSLQANQLETTSLDRIDSTKGYIRGNIQLVCSIVNRMKQDFSEEDFLRYCSFIATKNQKITYSN